MPLWRCAHSHGVQAPAAASQPPDASQGPGEATGEQNPACVAHDQPTLRLLVDVSLRTASQTCPQIPAQRAGPARGTPGDGHTACGTGCELGLRTELCTRPHGAGSPEAAPPARRPDQAPREERARQGGGEAARPKVPLHLQPQACHPARGTSDRDLGVRCSMKAGAGGRHHKPARPQGHPTRSGRVPGPPRTPGRHTPAPTAPARERKQSTRSSKQEGGRGARRPALRQPLGPRSPARARSADGGQRAAGSPGKGGG